MLVHVVTASGGRVCDRAPATRLIGSGGRSGGLMRVGLGDEARTS